MEITRQQIEEKLRELIKMAVANPADLPEVITEESNLNTDLGMTSMSLLYIAIAVEECFDMRFDDVGLGDFVTVGDVIDYIYRKKNQ